MSEPDPLPPLGAALGLLLFGAPLVVLALRRALRVLAARERPAHRFSGAEALAIVALPFLVLGVLSLLFAPAEGAHPDEPDVFLGLLGTQLVLGSAAALVCVLAARRANGLANVGLVTPPPRGSAGVVLSVYLPGSLCVAGLGLAWARACRAFGWEEKQEVLRLILGLERHELVAAAFVIVLVGPFIEELLFRGFLQTFLSQVMGERWALVLSAALFARLHGMAGLPSLFLLSVFLGWLQLRTRSLWAPTLAHALNNAVTLTLALTLGDRVEGLQ